MDLLLIYSVQFNRKQSRSGININMLVGEVECCLRSGNTGNIFLACFEGTNEVFQSL